MDLLMTHCSCQDVSISLSVTFSPAALPHPPLPAPIEHTVALLSPRTLGCKAQGKKQQHLERHWKTPEDV